MSNFELTLLVLFPTGYFLYAGYKYIINRRHITRRYQHLC